MSSMGSKSVPELDRNKSSVSGSGMSSRSVLDLVWVRNRFQNLGLSSVSLTV